MTFRSLFCCIVVSFCTFSCVNAFEERTGTMSVEDQIAPANTAVMPCIVWPTKHSFDRNSFVSFDQPQAKLACESFNSAVLTAFGGQPFMKGMTPKAVQKAMDALGLTNHLLELNSIVDNSVICRSCEGPLSFYRTSLLNNEKFRHWANNVKSTLPSADAILIPIIFDVIEIRDQDRGFPRIVRSAKASLILVKSYNLEIQWYSYRRGISSVVSSSNAEVSPPDWNSVFSQIFIDTLWKDFPGRQIFRE